MMLASRGMCAPGSILLQQLLYTHKAATQGRYTISCLYDAFMIRLSQQRPWKERFLLGETRAEKNRPSLLTSREHRWRLFTTLQKSPFSFPFSTQSYWLFFLPSADPTFHYFEVGTRSLMLDRLSGLPAGQSYSDWKGNTMPF